MINPVLERRYADCNELVEAWKAYLEFFNLSVKSEDFQSSPDQEQQFLDCKARIAMLHDSFMESLKHDQSVGQNMLSIVNRSITLNHVRKAGHADQKKIEIEWHECYLLLNETVSNLSEERDKLADVNEMAFKLGKVKARAMTNLKSFMRSVWFKVALSIFIVFAIIFGVPFFGIYDWNNLRSVQGIGEPYAKFVDIQREYLGISGPYSTIQAYMDAEVQSPPPNFDVQSHNEKKDTVAGSFQGAFDVDGQDAAEALKSAGEFRSVIVVNEDSGEQVTGYVFYWFEPGKPRQFVAAFDQAAADPNNYTARSLDSIYSRGYKENVLFLVSGNPETRDDFIVRVFR